MKLTYYTLRTYVMLYKVSKNPRYLVLVKQYLFRLKIEIRNQKKAKELEEKQSTSEETLILVA